MIKGEWEKAFFLLISSAMDKGKFESVKENLLNEKYDQALRDIPFRMVSFVVKSEKRKIFNRRIEEGREE